MNFKLPKEYEGFVSSADDILKQFKKIDDKNYLTFSIFSDSGTFSDYLVLRDNIYKKIRDLSSRHIWQISEPSLALVLSRVDAEVPVYLKGLNYYGDNVEDEWFLVSILLAISEEYHNLSVSISDVDGQFLLIEAAEFLPDWLGPENSLNRVWIRRGKIHIISNEEPGQLRSGGIKLKYALNALKSKDTNRMNTEASYQIQKMIYARSKDVYPAKSIANLHTAVCMVPKNIAIILLSNPQLISYAVEEFCNLNSKMKKFTSKMLRFGISQFVYVPIKFSKVLYAQLSFQPFSIPSIFHSIHQDKINNSLYNNKGNNNNHNKSMSKNSNKILQKLNKSFEFGCRIACAVEAAYQSSYSKYTINNNNNNSNNNDDVSLNVFQNNKKYYQQQLSRLGYDMRSSEKVLNFIESNRNDSNINLHNEINNYKICHSSIIFNPHTIESEDQYPSSESYDDTYQVPLPPLMPPEKLLELRMPYHILVDNILSNSNYESIASNEFISNYEDICLEYSVEDEDTWLSMTPEEFENEMNTRINSYQQQNESNDSQIRSEGGSTIKGTVADSESENICHSMNNLHIHKNEKNGENKNISENDEVIEKETIVNESVDKNSYDSLQHIVNSMNMFMNGKSGIEGIDSRSSIGNNNRENDQVRNKDKNHHIENSMNDNNKRDSNEKGKDNSNIGKISDYFSAEDLSLGGGSSDDEEEQEEEEQEGEQDSDDGELSLGNTSSHKNNNSNYEVENDQLRERLWSKLSSTTSGVGAYVLEDTVDAENDNAFDSDDEVPPVTTSTESSRSNNSLSVQAHSIHDMISNTKEDTEIQSDTDEEDSAYLNDEDFLRGYMVRNNIFISRLFVVFYIVLFLLDVIVC